MPAARTNGPMGTVPLFTPILPPMIEPVSHEALVKWKRDHRDCEAKMQTRCRVTGKDYNAVVQSVSDSFNPSLLDVFCELNLNVQSANATEGMLIAEIEHSVSSVKNNMLPDIEELFDRLLRMNMGESDVNARLIDYFKSFNAIVDDYGLTECFTGVNGAKQKCKVLIANLTPKSLKEEVKQYLRFTHADAATDARTLFRLVLEKANELERQHQRLRLQRRETTRSEMEKPRTEQSRKPKRRWESKRPAATDPSPATTATNPSRGKSDSKSKPSSSSSRPPSGPCPKCDELHGLRDCPQATPKEREELWKKMRDGRQGKKAKTKRLGEMLPFDDRVVTLNGELELPYCPDSGSDYIVIGRSHWEQLKAVDPTVEVKELDSLILNQTFGSTVVTAKWKAKLQVMIHTAVGPVSQ